MGDPTAVLDGGFVDHCNILEPINQPELENATMFYSSDLQPVSFPLSYWKTTGGAVTQLTTFYTPPLSHEN